jgi:hypothetical protein
MTIELSGISLPAVEDDGPDADQRAVADFATMQHHHVTDGHVGPDGQRAA